MGLGGEKNGSVNSICMWEFPKLPSSETGKLEGRVWAGRDIRISIGGTKMERNVCGRERGKPYENCELGAWR